jgi:hypothetical protein
MEIQCRICGEDIPIDYIKTHIQLAHENESLYLGSPENGEKKEKEEKEECLEENITYDIVQSRLRGVTSDFLQNLCSDFLRLRELLDIDQKLMKKLIKHIRSSVKSRIRNKKLAAVYRLPSQFLNKMIKGPLQGKKTWTIISIALYNLIQYKMSTIIVVEESIDSRKQMATRFGEVFEDYQKHMKKNGIKIPFSKEYFRILESKNVSDREICDSMTPEKPKIIIVLRSESNMKHLQKTIEKSPNKRFTLIIDESDAIDNASTCKAQKCLQNLKNSASSIFNVSATPMTTLCNNDIIQENTFVMSTPENYKGLNVIQIEQLPEEAFCSNNKDDDPFERDKNLMLFLEKFSQKPIFKDVHISSRCDMPAICLMHLGRTIDPQLKIVNFVHEKFPKKITTVTYNETVELRGETLPKVPIQIILPSGKSRFTKYENGILKLTLPKTEVAKPRQIRVS